MTAHAKLSASGAHRWMRCPGSVRMEEALPDHGSPFAAEGTAAHILAERCLREGSAPKDHLGWEITDEDTGLVFTVDTDMAHYVNQFVEYVRALPGEKRYEQRVSFDRYVPNGFGTVDVLVADGNHLTIVDLKYGKGVEVDAEDNPQLMLYALGALEAWGWAHDFETVTLVIHQPRIGNVSEWEDVSVATLTAKGVDFTAHAFNALSPDAPLVPGDVQCKFCKAKAHCPALAAHVMSIATHGFVPEDTPGTDELTPPETVDPPETLGVNRLASLLPHTAMIREWATALELRALSLLEAGEDVPGYKLVAGRRSRSWVDEAKTERTLRKAKLKVGDIFEKKMVSPAKAEKLLGRKHPALEGLIAEKDGKPALAPETDKRPALVPEKAADGFDPVA